MAINITVKGNANARSDHLIYKPGQKDEYRQKQMLTGTFPSSLLPHYNQHIFLLTPEQMHLVHLSLSSQYK